MATIRKTLSPISRAGTITNLEVCSVSSPLSKSSSSPQNSLLSEGLLPSSITSLDSRAFLFGGFSPRTLRAIERSNSKHKGQLWRKVLFHSFICFMVGVSIGLIPLASTNLSSKFMANHQGFSFEIISEVDNVKINKTPLVDEDVKFDAAMISALQEQELTDGVSYNISESEFTDETYLESRKLLIVITPTYNCSFQAYYLHSLSQTLKLVQPPLLWIVVEVNSQSEETSDILRSSGIMYRHLVCKMNVTNTSHKSILMRNVAIAHVETHRLDGIVYFADDDNVYSVDLFQQMREIRRFGTWIVAKLSEGTSGGIVFQGPICNGSEVIGWHTNNDSDRKSKRFHAEISGFAFNSTILWERKKWHRPLLERIRQLESAKENLWISMLIEQVVEDESQMEGLMNDCSRVMVWRIDLESSHSFYPRKWIAENNLDVIWNLSLV
ncbi:unnamed protein product [Lathyrus sativus]|nr:unnamed protein product [Lathyrus sativus]